MCLSNVGKIHMVFASNCYDDYYYTQKYIYLFITFYINSQTFKPQLHHKPQPNPTSTSKHAQRLTRLTSSSAFSSSVLSSRETCVGPRTDGEPFPLQSLCSGARKCPSEGGLELCILAERYRKGTYTGKRMQLHLSWKCSLIIIFLGALCGTFTFLV